MGFGGRRKIIVAVAIAALGSARARGADTAPPVSCNVEELERPFLGYQQLRDQVCNSLANDDCAQEKDTRPGLEGKNISICNLANQLMQEAAKRYHEDIHNYCPQLKSEFQICKTGDAKSITPCALSAASKMGGREQSIAAQITDYEGKLTALGLERKIAALKAKFQHDRGLLMLPNRTLNPDPAVVTQCGNSNNSPYPRQYYIHNLEPENGPDSVFTALDGLGKRVKSFLQAAGQAQARHQENAMKFSNQVTQLSNVTSRMGADDPAAVNGKSGGDKSDVTGGGKGGGGGGSGGGGSGSSGGTPNSLASATGSQGDAPGRSPASMGDSSSAGQAGANQAASQPSPSYSVGMNPNESNAGPSVQATASAWPRTAGAGAKSMTAYSSPGYGSGASSTRPNSATASGSGSTGGAGSDGPVAAAEKRCVGKECAGTGGAPAQFAAVGSLGALGGLEALAPLDGAGSLDGFLKDDKGKAFGGAGLDNGLANLDASTADLLAGSGAGDGSGRSSEIGAANDEDLFARLHQFHQRAQKRGMVVGLTRKL